MNFIGLESVSAELCFFLEALEKNVSCIFQLLEAAHIPWLVCLSSKVRSFSSCHPSGSLLHSSSTCKDPWYYIGSTLIIQENLPISRSAVSKHKSMQLQSPLSCNLIIIIASRGLEYEHFFFCLLQSLNIHIYILQLERIFPKFLHL